MPRTNTYIPNVTADTLMLQENDEDPLEDWEESVSEMFEWVGMAALGSQRLSAGDRCDPYISVYAPPDPSQVGDLTVIGWTGLITSEFLSQVVETILSPNVASPSFVSVTAHAVPTSPVTYIPDDPLKAHPSLRAPHVDAEDTISVVYMREEGAAGQAGCSWLLAESIGRWDKRRG
ncbi:hypothetical protein DICSQDRAFT_149928 [Dichomitus squalens LYAD-421 SS1]|uniref:Uncharacterized protein n=1 Tax=Dichomitus squalens (strain LYAD-421) TaxID=732165 RepID=R7SM60_DICSQ|nr:uncharacterized protein DICSQDRAFT_149928 [Dichomitus squalens LYAD-421 SS1]EJF57206.1 hypothetical protein DICSQDRAFT_149928 [Dichomitus squalens LYAD-421 SS1]